MKILYGVQGTGNGHITRARVMAKALQEQNIEVDYLFSGRSTHQYFDMQRFSHAIYKRGLTFEIIDGQIKFFKTLIKNNLLTFNREVSNCDLSNYDCVLCDFEPITAWAAKKHDIPILGIGHQYVFDYEVPKQKTNWLNQKILHQFAPTKHVMPLHWHHFNAPIAPPIIENFEPIKQANSDHVLVYLPFENQQKAVNLLQQITSHKFIIYTPDKPVIQTQNVVAKTLSRQGFQQDLHSCDAVIANAGFELSSEAINLGKKLLVRPLKGQYEQHANALALDTLKYGHIMNEITIKNIQKFLVSEKRVKIQFPDVANHIVSWVNAGFPTRNNDWYQSLWNKVTVIRN